MRVFYNIYDMTISSQLELSGVQVYSEIEINKIDVDIEVRKPAHALSKKIETMKSDPEIEFCEKSIFIHFQDGWSLCISKAGNKITIYADECNFSKASTLVLGTGLSILMLYRGLYPLHAGGFALDNKGIAIAGNSGVGKSTFVRNIMKRGYKIISDDCLPMKRILNQVVVLPSLTLKSKVRNEIIEHFSIPLSETSKETLYNGKKWVSIDKKERVMHAMPLKAIYFLIPNNNLNQILIEPVIEREKSRHFFEHVLCFTDLPVIDIKKNLLIGKSFVDCIEMYKLLFPKGLNYLDIALDAIIMNEKGELEREGEGIG